jgi:hypothetical protein
MRYRAQVPFIDNLLDEIGMSPNEIGNIKNILGEYKKDEDKDQDIEGEEA